MRCSSIKQNKCWNGVEWKRTHYCFRFIHHLFHIQVIHMSLLKWVGFGSISSIHFWTFVGIVPSLLAFVTRDIRQISLALRVGTVLSVVPIGVSIAMAIVMSIAMAIV